MSRIRIIIRFSPVVTAVLVILTAVAIAEVWLHWLYP